MIPKKDIFDLASGLIKASPADETEVYFSEGDSSLTRFANNTIHQNVSVTNAQVLLRVAFGKRVGVASSNSLENAGRAVDEACAIARVSGESADFAGLPSPLPVRRVKAFDDAAAGCDAAGRAARVRNVVDEAKRVGAVAAGAFSTEAFQTAVVNSKGVRAWHRGTEVAYEIKGGRLGTMYKNPTYTGITPEFWGSCDAVCGRGHWQMWGTPNCGKGEPMQSAHVGHGTAPARFRNVRVGVLR